MNGYFGRIATLTLLFAAMPPPCAHANATWRHVAAGIAAAAGGGDCNDLDPGVHPGAAEIAGNGIDDDCDGIADEDAADNPSTDTSDADGDGFALANGDCNDHDGAIRPGTAEVVGNYVDDDCDGMADEDALGNPSLDTVDRDSDGVPIAPDAIFASGFELVPA